MAHMISKIDRQQGIEQAWHGLTEVLPSINLNDCWLSQWDIIKRPLEIRTDFGLIESEYCQLVASDNQRIAIGRPVHCQTYSPLTNADFLATIKDALLGIDGATVASVGSVCERGRVFVSVRLKQLESFKAAGREFKSHLNFLNSHDQSCAFVVNTSNICTVCNNTFSANLHTKDKNVNVKIRHTKSMAAKIENVADIVQGYLGAQAEFKAIMDVLNKKPVAIKDARPLFAGFLASEGEELSTRRSNQIDRLTELFEDGAGNNGETRADAFSAVTDYYTHESSGGTENPNRQIVSSEFGSGNRRKQEMYQLLQNDDLVEKTIQNGRSILKAAGVN